MNDFTELEAELKKLRPAAASLELTRRVEETLAAAPLATAGVLPQPAKARRNWFALGFGLAAAAILLVIVRVNFDGVPAAKPKAIATAPAAQNFQPDGITRVVYHTSDEGLVYPADASEPARRLRSRLRETLHWKDAGSGASLRVSYPTEEVRLIPVSISGQ